MSFDAFYCPDCGKTFASPGVCDKRHASRLLLRPNVTDPALLAEHDDRELPAGVVEEPPGEHGQAILANRRPDFRLITWPIDP